MSEPKPAKKAQEKDFIRSTFRAMNVQALLALVMIIFVPYLLLFHYMDFLITDVRDLTRNYAREIYGQFSTDPTREHALALAAEHEMLLGFEGREGFWYTDGESITDIMPDMARPYYRGIWSSFDTPDEERVIICWPSDFYIAEIHFRVFMTWAGAPILFFLALFFFSRRTLYPMRWVQSGINELASGNLRYQAPVTGRDRKNILAKRFNAMTASIRELIHSKDQLIMDVSHELRSPVTRIKVALEMLKGDNKDDGSASARIETLEKNVQELEEIISTILESQRINLQDLETEMRPQRFGGIILESVELQRDAAPGFDISGVDTEIMVNGDRSLLKLLVHNLLDNAVKYSRAGSAPVRVCLEQRNGMLLLQVIDDGIGIETEHLQRVFDPFYKVARERGFNSGYGLGLSLCRRIAELHGGKISLENNPGGGVTAKVSLPPA